MIQLIGRRLLKLARSVVNADSKGKAIPHSCDSVLQYEEDQNKQQPTDYSVY